jgi:TonB family protein
MARSERFAWARRDGAPLAVSLVLHVVALLLIAPWLVMRTIPEQPIEVEVMLEPDVPEVPSSRPAKVARLRDLVRIERPATQTLRPRLAQIKPVEPQPLQSTVSEIRLPASPAPAAAEGQGQSGRGAPAPRETAGLSAPASPAVRSAALAASVGTTPLQRGGLEAAPAAPSAPSAGSAPERSARAAAAPSLPGEEREDGPLTLAGPAPQPQASEPEFRQAARQGGHASMRGGSLAPDDGAARPAGAPEQTALQAARPLPPAVAGAGGGAPSGGTPPALAAPPVQSGGRGGTAVTESGGTPARALAAAPVAGQAAPFASRAQAGSGLSDAGLGSGARTVGTDERGSGLIAAAAPAAAGPGSAAAGNGPGASDAGAGRALALAGSGAAARDSGAPMQAAGGGGDPARGDADGAGAQLTGRADGAAPAQPLREARAAALQTQQPTGQARVIEERFSAAALKVSSPRTVCELPLMLAGFDRKPIPKGLDVINASAPLAGEVPPRHHPGNQAPRYPLLGLGQRAEGRALVRAEIRPDGLVGQLWIKQSSGFLALDQAALETVRSWRFFPAQRHGMAVAMWMDVPIEYKMP